ncbi:MAG TPA: flagellar biosynthetic protein FliO [Solirubrobacteraceae bacterium]|nr:flagellar biosynthetic protein FliO [Solirubrobacteraceae bacterium]
MRSITLTRGAVLGGALAVCCAPVALAAPTGESTPLHLGSSTAVHAASSGGSSILRTLVALVVVVGVIYAIARILRAIKGRDAVRASGSGLEQIASLPLAPGRSVALVRSGRAIVLVGVAEHAVTAIKTYTEAEALAVGIELPRPGAAREDPERPVERALDRLRRMTVRA